MIFRLHVLIMQIPQNLHDLQIREIRINPGSRFECGV